MTFEKTADQETWIYMEDPDFPLAQQYPEEMENTFEKLEVKRELKDGDELSSYGLDEPQYQVTLTDHRLFLLFLHPIRFLSVLCAPPAEPYDKSGCQYHDRNTEDHKQA